MYIQNGNYFFFYDFEGIFPLWMFQLPELVALAVSLLLLLVCFSFWSIIRVHFCLQCSPYEDVPGLDPFYPWMMLGRLCVLFIISCFHGNFLELFLWRFCTSFFFIFHFFLFVSHFLLYFLGRFPQFYLETPAKILLLHVLLIFLVEIVRRCSFFYPSAFVLYVLSIDLLRILTVSFCFVFPFDSFCFVFSKLLFLLLLQSQCFLRNTFLRCLVLLAS